MFKMIGKKLDENNKETRLADVSEKIWDLLKELPYDKEKAEVVNTIRLKFQVYVEMEHDKVTKHKADLETIIEILNKEVDKTEVQKEKTSLLEKFASTLFGGKSSKTKDDKLVIAS